METIALTTEVISRFWSKVDKSRSCWTWTARRDRHGYGQFSYGGKHHRSHRVAYLIASGGIPDGAHLDHICRVRACVNPSHLRPVNNKQNQEHREGSQTNNTSGARGVYRNKLNGNWRARVRHLGKMHEAGSFDTFAEAEAAAIAKRLELFTHNELDRKAA